jgi:hypothetical protein
MGGVMGTEALKKKMKEFCEGNEDLYQQAEAIFDYGEKKQNMANLDKLIKKQLDDAYDTDEESETEEEESDVTEEQAGA